MSQKRAKAMAKILAIIIVAALVLGTFAYILGEEVYGAEESNNEAFPKDKLNYLEAVIKDIQKLYKDDVTYDTLLDGAYQGIFDALEDPYSVYYEASTGQAEEFMESVSGEFYGVGVQVSEYQGQCQVIGVLKDTPAEAGGIRAGDVITHVDGKDMEGMSANQVVVLIRGEKDTKVTLTVMRDGASLEFTLTRTLIRQEAVSYEVMNDHIGYIRISQFDSDTHKEFLAAKLILRNKEDVDSFIIDLRNNTGGLIQPALNIAEQLMPAGPIMHFARKGEIAETFNASGTGDIKVPTVVLVNAYTASASEILAAALQESGEAQVVGVTTFGKGVAQQVMNLSNGDSIKLSIYYFLTPDQNPIDGVGIQPDYIVDNYEGRDVDALTAEYLTFAPMSETAKPKAGDKGLNVYGAQQRLAFLGHEVNVTGTMDADTVSAIKAFQKDQGLYAYGALDYTTRDALDAAARRFAAGADMETDLQLEKALELLQ